MRKSAGLLMAMAFMAVMASSAGAAGNSSWGVTGGAAVPTGDFSNAANTGYNFGGTGTVMLNQSWGVGADVAYHMWNGSSDLNTGTQLLLGDPSAEWKFSAIQGTGNLQYMIPAQGVVHPWLKGGLGLYDIKAKLDSDSGSSDSSENDFGWNLGGGFNYAVSPAYSLGLGGAYHAIQTSPSTTNLFTVNATLLFGGSK